MAVYRRESEIKAFDDTKTGVKGLVDAGITEIPQFFHHSPDQSHLPDLTAADRHEKAPIIDIETLNGDLAGRKTVIDLFIAADCSENAPIIEFRNLNGDLTGRKAEVDLISAADCSENIPIIDIGNLDGDLAGREATVDLVRRACESFGFFQVTNHGVPQEVLDEMLNGVRRFHEQDSEVKKRYYTRDSSMTVIYNSNFDLYVSPAANWRDTLFCRMAPEPGALPEDIPEVCRDITMEYTGHVRRLGRVLLQLLYEGLGLEPTYLSELAVGETIFHLSHYYPECPQPNLTLGTSAHADPDFLTVLLQDMAGGLQVRHRDRWIDVPPVAGALVVNVGDHMQLISNDKYKSSEHRVLASNVGPRLSAACFFSGQYVSRHYGPIKKLLSDNAPPKYRDITLIEYGIQYNTKGLDGKSALDYFRV